MALLNIQAVKNYVHDFSSMSILFSTRGCIILIAITETDGQTSIYFVAQTRPVLNAQIKAFLDSWYEDTVKRNSVQLSTYEDRNNGCVYLKVKHLK